MDPVAYIPGTAVPLTGGYGVTVPGSLAPAQQATAQANPVQADPFPAQLDAARKSGYSDQEIFSHLAQSDPRFSRAAAAGYGSGDLDSISAHIGQTLKAPDSDFTTPTGPMAGPGQSTLTPGGQKFFGGIRTAMQYAPVWGAAGPVQDLIERGVGKGAASLGNSWGNAGRTALDVGGIVGAMLPGAGGQIGKAALGGSAGGGLAAGVASAAGAGPITQALAGLTGGIVGGGALAGAGNTARALENASGPLETAAALGKGALGLNSATVPRGQEANAVLRLAQQKFGLPNTIEIPNEGINAGQFRDILGQGRSALGAQQGAARDAAYAAAQDALSRAPGGASGLPDLLQQAIGNTMTRFGGGEIPELAQSPEAAARLQALGKNTIPQISSLEQANALQRQLANAAREAGKPLASTAPQAAMLGNAAGNVDSVIKSFIPEGDALNNLNVANQKFSSFANLQKVFGRAVDSSGNFNPKAAVKAWNVLTPTQKIQMFQGPGELDAIDSMLKQSGPGALSRIGNLITTPIKKLMSETVLRDSQLGAMLERPPTPQVRFTQPGFENISGWSRILPWLQAPVQNGQPLAAQ